MPEWLEAIRTEVPDHQLKEFREVLRYIHLPKVFYVFLFASSINLRQKKWMDFDPI